ncbi:choice-of-anchor J domain-containing protein [Pontibacter burrus]|uniref:T9SS type A sorting domain-containing protein n=1 Tax=Pontibacter burrus TaxID=2704466 RepID=A0A6B3LN03_9BACT|nr:Calx-beta domain-containing protein [Pontibacter burrus]NEM98302.1 T9SS type A sorting domain-containing protein [Pontibacter burrus]
MSKHLQKLFALVVVCCAFFGSSTAWGQVLLSEGSSYSQNFNTLATTGTTNVWTNNTTIAGWYSTRTIYQASPGSANAGALYSFGNSADRSLGAVQSNSTGAIAYGVQFQNKSGSKISSVKVKYIGEQWRNGGNASAQTIEFSYGVTAAAITEITATLDNFTRVSELDFVSPVTGTTAAALDGNASANRQVIEHSFNVNIEDGEFFTIKWIDANDAGNDHGLSVDDFEFTPVYDSQITTPTLKTDVTTINLGEKAVNTTFQGSYLLSAKNIAANENITVTADAPFTISTSETGVYTNTLTFTGDELAADTRIYVRVKPATIGVVIGNITHTAKDATDVVVAVSAIASSPFAQNFDNCGTTLPGGWTAYNVTGDQVWGCTTFGRTGNAVQLNGFANSKSNNNEDWLISPALDLTATNIPVLSFWTISAFNGPALKVMVSTNYDGTSAPSTATWTELNVSLPAVGSDTWTQSEFLLDQYKQSAVYIAFVYTSKDETNGASRWTLDDFSINNETTKFVAGNASFDFGAVAAGSTSAAQTVTFKAIGFTEEFTFSSNTADFEVSKDNTTFGQTATYTAAEAAAGAELFVRFSPKSTALRIEGTLKATSGTNFETVLGTVKGTSMLRSATLDVVTWNMEWFGADKDEKGAELGPADEALQFANAKKVFTDLDADILALQEVSNDTEIQRLATELGYNFVVSDAYSYSWDATRNLVPQKLYFLYKPEVAKVKNQKVLLSKFYEDVRNGQYADAFVGYPEGGAKFWASGRLPFMVEFETTINNVKQNISLVNLHTRANSGTDVSKHTQRKFDVEMLKDSLDAHYAGKNIIILGDYNDDVDVSVVNNLPSTFEKFVNDANYNALTLDISKAGGYTYESGSFKSFLDHIIVSSSLSDDYINGSITIEDHFVGSISGFRNTTSDHVPVSARFDLSATPMVTFTEATATKAEGSEKYNVSLTLSAAQTTAQTVTIGVANGATASSADYTVTGATNGVVTVTVPANATTATFEVEITDDNEIEADEQVVFQITDKSANLIIGAANTYTLTITDNDKATVTFAAASKEVSENAGVTEVTLNLDKAHIADQTITVAVTNGAGVTYGTNGDYTTTPAVADNKVEITVPAGATTAKFEISVNDDTEVEANEQITFEITGVSAGLVIGDAKSYALTITDNDKSTVTFAVATKSVNEDTGVTEVTLSLDKAPIAEQQITIAVTNGTGVTYGATGDYTTTPAVADDKIEVTVLAGATTAKFEVSVKDDTDVENAEQIAFEITGVSAGLVIGDAKAYTLTIADNDKPTITFAAAAKTVSENAGVTEVTLSLDQAPLADQQITVAVTNGTGVTYGATGDYTTTPATVDGKLVVTVPAGATTAKFEISVNDDTDVEANEVVTFQITDANANITIGEVKTYALTITDNDKSTVTFAAATKSVSEDAGVMEVTLSLDKAPVAEQQITIAVTNGTGVTYGATGDYTTTPAVADGKLVVTVPAGATSVKFNITFNDDTETEQAEQVTFEITSVSNALAIGTAKTFTLTIEANDAPTGIADGTKGQFSVYPTIVNGGNVRLQLPERVAPSAKVNMVVYSTDGKKVLTTTGTQAAVQTALNSKVNAMPAGIYIILIETGKEYFQTKMVKN